MSAFLQLIADRDEDALREALQINPDLAVTPDPRTDVMPLNYAARLGNSTAVLALLQAAADPNKVYKGRAALDVAAFHDAEASGEALLDFGADPNIRDEIGRTPLMTAAKFGSLRMLDLLLSRGADVRHVDLHGRTALHWAATGEHSNPEIVRRLLAAGAERNRQNSDGLTAADYARRMKLPELLSELEGSQA